MSYLAASSGPAPLAMAEDAPFIMATVPTRSNIPRTRWRLVRGSKLLRLSEFPSPKTSASIVIERLHALIIIVARICLCSHSQVGLSLVFVKISNSFDPNK